MSVLFIAPISGAVVVYVSSIYLGRLSCEMVV